MVHRVLRTLKHGKTEVYHNLIAELDLKEREYFEYHENCFDSLDRGHYWSFQLEKNLCYSKLKSRTSEYTNESKKDNISENNLIIGSSI